MVKKSTYFDQAYQDLNTAQRHAVDTIDGPVMVIAGPGTGKTQILATRIANILLKTDTNPYAVLALTFTESGAQTMKRRLISLIGETAYSVQIMTFHGFCSEVIATHPEYFPLPPESSALSDLERFQLFESILLEQSFTHIKPINAPLLYLKTAMSHIQNLKREGISPEEFAKILEQESNLIESDSESWRKAEREKRKKNYARNVELHQVYQLYQQKIKAIGKFDFEDMINFVVDGFTTHELLLLEYQEKLQYFLIDEYQDTNSSQNKVIQQLSSFWGEEANVFVVGDPNQSIYRFQGASLENTFQFLSTFPNATLITLTENYRSTQLILDTAQAVISHQQPSKQTPISLTTRLHANHDHSSPVQIYHASSNILEYVYIAEKISALISQGIKPEEIVVIYRNNFESHAISDVLSRWGIQYEIEGGSDVLRNPTITQLLTFLSVIHDVRSSVEDINLFTLLNYSWTKLNALAILKLVRHAQTEKITLYSLLLDTVKVDAFAQTLTEPEKVHVQEIVAFAQKLAFWSGLDTQIIFPSWIEQIVSESGFLYHFLNTPNSVEHLHTIHTLFSEIKKLAISDHTLHLSGYLQIVKVMMEHNLQLPAEDLNLTANAVKLITAHKSKGQEWEHVFITGLMDKRWGNGTKRELIKLPEGILKFSVTEKEDSLDDDRRLFYVALTRARSQIYLTVPMTIQSGGKSRETTESLFMQEIPEEFCEKDTVFETQQNIPLLMTKLVSTPPPPVETSNQEEVFLRSILEHFKLSATALNVYLTCPYKFKLQNLFKLPRSKPAHLAFGTAVHAALEFLFGYMKDHGGEVPTLSQVMAHFQQELRKEILTEADYIVRLQKGQEVLTNYIQEYQESFITPLFVEKYFGAGFSRPVLDDIPLSGKMDKIEWLNQVDNTVKVVDYKTGRPRTKGEIEGTTQNSTGDYKRQLVFYKLLAELDRSFKLVVEQAEFDFVEPNTTGKYVRHTFSISNLEVEDLKILIREVMVKIRNLEFPRTTDLSVCEDCVFKDHCWPEGLGN